MTPHAEFFAQPGTLTPEIIEETEFENGDMPSPSLALFANQISHAAFNSRLRLLSSMYRRDSLLKSEGVDPMFEIYDSYSTHLQILYALSLHALFSASSAGSSLSTGYVSVSRSISSNFTTFVRFSTFHPKYMTNMMGNST